VFAQVDQHVRVWRAGQF